MYICGFRGNVHFPTGNHHLWDMTISFGVGEECPVTRQRRFWLSFQVGCTYIGTVVGAGFASGQEIFQFFARYGTWGYLAICLSTLLFASLGYKILWLGHYLRARSYRELNTYLFGPKIGPVADVVLIFMLFGVTVAMIAGAGELFHERLGISFQVGALATMVFTFVTVIRGMSGIMKANTFIVPTMISFVLYAALQALHQHGWQPAWHAGQALETKTIVIPLISSILYAAFNIGLAAGVLLPLGCDMEDVGILRKGALFGALGLGVMLAAVMFTLLTHYPQALDWSVPMGYVATQLGPFIQWMFVFVLWGEIYSTLVGDVFAVTMQCPTADGRKQAYLSAALLFVAYLVSQVGFAAIVKYAYTVFGVVSLMLVMALLVPRGRLPRM
jgi:uncharacterized membrane protein YkvI